MTNSLHYIHHNSDIFEVSFHGCVIARITCYFHGSAQRLDVQYDDLPREVQDKILDKVNTILLKRD